MMQKTSGLCANNLVDFEDLRSRLRVPFSIKMIMLMCWSTLSLEMHSFLIQKLQLFTLQSTLESFNTHFVMVIRRAK